MIHNDCQCSHCKELRRQQLRAYLRHEKLLKIKEKHETNNHGAGIKIC